jgi:hypothetical protein
MGWVYEQSRHAKCRFPVEGAVGKTPGDLWQCDTCGRLWVLTLSALAGNRTDGRMPQWKPYGV